MKASVMDGFNAPFVIREVKYPTLTDDGVIIKVEATGVCRSDWHAWAGEWRGAVPKFPHILGHEMSGVVAEVGANIRNFKPGDRVVVPFSQGDGVCQECVAGYQNVCEHLEMPGFTYHGGFAEYAHIPGADRNLIHLPNGVGFVEASAMGCRFMTAFHGVVHRGHVRPGEWVVVFGTGGVGLSAIQIANAMGANVVAVDISNEKLEFAKQFGALATVNSSKGSVSKAVREITHGGAHVTIDALGIQETCLNAVLSLRKRGRHVQIGMTSYENGGKLQIPLNYIVNSEIQFCGSFGMPTNEFPAMLQMVEKGRLHPGKLVTKTISLEEIGSAFEEMTNFSGIGVTVVTKF